jgi:hypothetical protein
LVLLDRLTWCFKREVLPLFFLSYKLPTTATRIVVIVIVSAVVIIGIVVVIVVVIVSVIPIISVTSSSPTTSY